MSYADYHNRGFAGIYEEENIGGDKFGLHVTSWWNGEGVDVTLYNHKGEKHNTAAYTGFELTGLAALGIVSGYVDLDELVEIVEKLKKDHADREARMKKVDF